MPKPMEYGINTTLSWRKAQTEKKTKKKIFNKRNDKEKLKTGEERTRRMKNCTTGEGVSLALADVETKRVLPEKGEPDLPA